MSGPIDDGLVLEEGVVDSPSRNSDSTGGGEYTLKDHDDNNHCLHGHLGWKGAACRLGVHFLERVL